MGPVSSITGIDLGFEVGYYTNFGERSSIFMRTDLKGSEVRRLLTHEYIHHIFDGLANDFPLPAWLTEGLSKYYKFDTALSGVQPDATNLRQLTAADLARAGARSGPLFTLVALESQNDWNSRAGENELALQYSEVYMPCAFQTRPTAPCQART